MNPGLILGDRMQGFFFHVTVICDMVVGASHVVLSPTKFGMIQIVGWHGTMHKIIITIAIYSCMGIMLCRALCQYAKL